MGRGRAKAKQTKVARKLKYYSPDTDYTALERELGGGQSVTGDHADDDYSDAYPPEYSDDEERVSGER
ncbi:DUF3073 domain-containing protein [Spelaeicoccus albus]|nr:DUF3073 domain-containing protein [Spelaeicoccus albus]